MKKHLPTAGEVKMGLIGLVVAVIVIGAIEVRAAAPTVKFQQTEVILREGGTLNRVYDRELKVACYFHSASNAVSCVRVGD